MKSCIICFLVGVAVSSGGAYVYIQDMKSELKQASKNTTEKAEEIIADKLKDSVKQTADDAKRLGKQVIEGAKEKIHEATKPSE